MRFSLLNRIADTQKDRKHVAFFLPLLLLILLSVVQPKSANAQTFNPLISFSVESCSLDKALEKLFAEYELNVAFSKAEMSKIRIEKYSCSYKSVEEVLTDLLKGTDYGFKKIGKNAFENCQELAAIRLNGVTSIGDEAFLNCTGLRFVIVRGDTEVADEAFSGCYNLSAIVHNN